MFDVMTIESKEKLIRPINDNDDGMVLNYLKFDELFSIIYVIQIKLVLRVFHMMYFSNKNKKDVTNLFEKSNKNIEDRINTYCEKID